MSNAYYEVTEPFEAFLRLGSTDDSNTYSGSCKALGLVYLRREVPAGSRMAVVPGGRFVEVDGTLYEAKLRLSGKHPFEKVYSPEREEEPAGLVVTGKFDVQQPAVRRFSWRKLLDAGVKPYGRGIDFVLTGEVERYLKEEG